MSTERLLNTLTGKSFSDPYTDVASLLKLNVGGLILAAVVGLAALFFVPSLLPGKLPGLFSQGFPNGLMPAFFDQLAPGLGLNKPFGYGQYDHAYDPYSGDYSSSGSYNQRNQENFDNRGRALKRDARNGTVYSEILSTVHKTVSNYWGEMEACASHAMCLKGKEIMEGKQKRAEESKKTRHSRRPDDPSDPESLSSFEHVLEAIHGMKGITKNMPMFHELHKAYKSGQNGADCSNEFKKCPVTADRISKTLNNMGNYIFNN
ncbi:unnamed protein product [Allacma fusca]|uniref:Uncharacterized protein n=2 Tax=Allacma fusca TaxID=39272 RepID=A0A8J2K4V3_9HEXA|nr:unnamed protein product [Allacma fusca]